MGCSIQPISKLEVMEKKNQNNEILKLDVTKNIIHATIIFKTSLKSPKYTEVWSLRNPVRRTSPSMCRLLTLAGLGVSPGGFRAESRTFLGSQAPRVEAFQGFYYSDFIQPKNQTNKQKNLLNRSNKQ